MPLEVLVVARGEHVRGHVALEVGDFLGAFVDEERDQLHLRVVVLDAEGDVLEEDRLAHLGRRDDEAARTEADRAEHVDQPAGRRAAAVFERHARLRVERGEFRERLALAVHVGRHALDGDQPACHHAHLPAAARLPFLHLDGDGRAGRDAVLLHELGEHDGIILALDETV